MRYVSPISLLVTFGMKGVLKSISRSRGAHQFDEIMIVDPRRTTPGFYPAVLSALLLIREVDPRRYAHVRRHLRWIDNATLPGAGAAYLRGLGCSIYFREPESPAQRSYCVANCATTLVYEAMRGVIAIRGIRSTRTRRGRVARLCFKEEQRFIDAVARVRPDLLEYFKHLRREFDESRWHAAWNMSRWQAAVLLLRLNRADEKLRKEQGEKD